MLGCAAVALTVAGVYALIRSKPWGFLAFLPVNALTAYQAYQSGLWAISVAQVLLFSMGAYGWWAWWMAAQEEPEPRSDGFCCPVRAKYVCGIVGTRSDQPAPVELVNYISDWHPNEDRIAQARCGPEPIPTQYGPEGAPITISFWYCPFCGARTPVE